MDEATTRRYISEHADAVVRGDMDALPSDFSEALRPRLPELAQALPQPVISSEIQSIEIGDQESVSTIRYAGDGSAVTIRARWQQEGDRPVIVDAQPVG